jgi:hypothetical protein
MIEEKRKAVEANSTEWLAGRKGKRNQLRQDMSLLLSQFTEQILNICQFDARYVVVSCNFRGGIPRLGFRWIAGAS